MGLALQKFLPTEYCSEAVRPLNVYFSFLMTMQIACLPFPSQEHKTHTKNTRRAGSKSVLSEDF